MNDSLPTSLTRFGDELEHAIARELATPEPTPPHHRRRPPRRRWMLVGAAAGCAVAGAAAAVVVATSGGSNNSAWSTRVLRAAEIALPKPAPNTIVHVSVTQTMTASARHYAADSVPVVSAEGWFQQGGAWRWITRETVPGGTPIWQTDSSVYDAATHRVYVMPPIPGGHPRYTLSKTKDGSYTLRIDGPAGPVRETATAAQARALRTGADQIQWARTWNGHHAALFGMIGSSARSSIQSQQPDETSLSFPAQVHRLLQSGDARVAGRVTVDGRAAIKIELPGAHSKLWMTYYVDPTTYAPIEYDSYGFGNPKDVTRVVFHTYQQLPVNGNARLLRLPVPAGATVEHSATGYFQHLPATLFIW